MSRKKTADLPEGLRVRNQGIQRVKLSDILENPENYRMHGDDQRSGFRAVVEKIGFYGYQDVFEHPDYPGKFMLIDGALRREDLIDQYGEDAYIDVNVTDFDPEEAKVALATKDPLTAMANTERQMYGDLLSSLSESENSEDMQKLLNDLAKMEKVDLAGLAGDLDDDGYYAAPEDFDSVDDDLQTEHKCPKCGYEWSGKTK